MRDKNLIVANNTTPKFCGLPEPPSEIPLRIKRELAPHALADSEFKRVPTEDLLHLARTRKRVYVTDRATAIAALKGVVNAGGKVPGFGEFVARQR